MSKIRRYEITECVYGGKRVWIYAPDLSQLTHQMLDILSKWGGADKRTEQYTSWEFSDEMLPAVQRILHKEST